MGQELEYKFRAEGEELLLRVFHGLCGNLPTRKIEMQTRYFDTPEGCLREKRCTLRIRRENGQEVLTYKTPAQGHLRGEWSLVRDSAAPTPERQELCTLGAQGLEALAGRLVPMCGATFLRTCCRICYNGSVIEAAADIGSLWGGGRALPLCELELELISGNAAALTSLANTCPLPEEPNSKAKRAFSLLESHNKP